MNPFKKFINKIADKIMIRIEESFTLEERQRWIKQKNNLELKMRWMIVEKEMRRQLYTFISSALGFVAALFWRDALVQILRDFLPYTEQWFPKLITAILISIFAIIGILLVNEVLMRKDKIRRR